MAAAVGAMRLLSAVLLVLLLLLLSSASSSSSSSSSCALIRGAHAQSTTSAISTTSPAATTSTGGGGGGNGTAPPPPSSSSSSSSSPSPSGDDGGDDAAGGHGEDGDGVSVISFHVTALSGGLLVWLLLLLGVTLCRVLFHWFEVSAVPESALVVVLGAILGGILLLAGVGESALDFDPDVFFLILIPPIILEAGYHLHADFFFENLNLILLYAFVGTVLNAMLTGGSLLAASSLGAFTGTPSWLDLAAFASLISAVDPVAVLAIFEAIHVNETLYILVFGESVLNDAVSIVLYRLFLSFRTISDFSAGLVFIGILKFFVVALGGLLAGIIMGLLAAFVTKYTKPIHTLETLVMYIFANLAYILAEMLELSGIMAMLFCGLTMSRYLEANIHKRSHVTIDYTLRIYASTAETVVFMYLGLSTVYYIWAPDRDDSSENRWDAGFTLITLAVVLPIRFAVTLLLTLIANRDRLKPIALKDQLVMAYGGLRGAIAFALAATLPSDMAFKDIMIGTTLAVILWTIFVQGTTIKPLIRRFHVALATDAEQDHETATKVFSRGFEHIMDGMHLITDGYHTGWFGVVGLWRRADQKLSQLVIRKERYLGTGSSILGTITTFQKYEAYLAATRGPQAVRPAHTHGHGHGPGHESHSTAGSAQRPNMPHGGSTMVLNHDHDEPHDVSHLDPMRLVWHDWVYHHGGSAQDLPAMFGGGVEGMDAIAAADRAGSGDEEEDEEDDEAGATDRSRDHRGLSGLRRRLLRRDGGSSSASSSSKRSARKGDGGAKSEKKGAKKDGKKGGSSTEAELRRARKQRKDLASGATGFGEFRSRVADYDRDKKRAKALKAERAQAREEDETVSMSSLSRVSSSSPPTPRSRDGSPSSSSSSSDSSGESGDGDGPGGSGGKGCKVVKAASLPSRREREVQRLEQLRQQEAERSPSPRQHHRGRGTRSMLGSRRGPRQVSSSSSSSDDMTGTSMTSMGSVGAGVYGRPRRPSVADDLPDHMREALMQHTRSSLHAFHHAAAVPGRHNSRLHARASASAIYGSRLHTPTMDEDSPRRRLHVMGPAPEDSLHAAQHLSTSRRLLAGMSEDTVEGRRLRREATESAVLREAAALTRVGARPERHVSFLHAGRGRHHHHHRHRHDSSESGSSTSSRSSSETSCTPSAGCDDDNDDDALGAEAAAAARDHRQRRRRGRRARGGRRAPRRLAAGQRHHQSAPQLLSASADDDEEEGASATRTSGGGSGSSSSSSGGGGVASDDSSDTSSSSTLSPSSDES